MNDEQLKEKLREFFKSHDLCVVSSIHAEKSGPESAVVAFSEGENLEIIIGTSNESRKYKNIQKNNNVSLVIGWNSEVGSVQYEGIATEIPQEKSAPYAERHVKKNPGAKVFADRPDQKYFIIKPTWIRLLDTAGNPPNTYELTF